MSEKPILLDKMEEILTQAPKEFTLKQLENELRKIKPTITRQTINNYVEILFLKEKIRFMDKNGNDINLEQKKQQQYAKPLKILQNDIFPEKSPSHNDQIIKNYLKSDLMLTKVNCIEFFEIMLGREFNTKNINPFLIKIHHVLKNFNNSEYFTPNYPFSYLIFEKYFSSLIIEKVWRLFDLFCTLNNNGDLRTFIISHKTLEHLFNQFFNKNESGNLKKFNFYLRMRKIREKYKHIKKEIIKFRNNEDIKFNDRILYYTTLNQVLKNI